MSTIPKTEFVSTTATNCDKNVDVNDDKKVTPADSELTKKLELAKCLTKESLDICENIFLDSSNNSDYENNMNQWFNNVSVIFNIVFFPHA